MTSQLDQTIAEITNYNDPTPRLIEVMSHGEARLFLGDARVAQGELCHVSSTGETLRVKALTGQREALAGTLNGTLTATASAQFEATGEQALFPAPGEHTFVMSQARYVSAHTGGLTVEVELPKFGQLDGARVLMPTGMDALDVLSPLSQGGVNLVIDATTTRQGFMALRQRVSDALGDTVSPVTVHTTQGALTGAREVIPANPSREAFYMALKVAASWAASCRAQGEEQLFIVELPVMSTQEAWQHYSVSRGERSGREMSYAEVIGWIGDHFTSTTSARITTLVTFTMPGAEGDLGDIIDTMGLGDVDAVVVIDEQGRYAPQRSRSRTPQPADMATEAMRVRGMLHRADQIAQKIALFGEDDLEPGELATHHEATSWRPVVTQP